MPSTAFMTQFRQETIKGFEKEDSLVASLCTNEMVRSGNTATFLVCDSGGATTTTRGVNGDIPARDDNLAQLECTLTEQHDLVRRTGFNIFASQGDGRRIMQETSRAVVNRKKDQIVYDALTTASGTWGSAAVATIALVLKAKATLNQASVLNKRDRLSAAITPAFQGELMKLDQYTSADYVKGQKFENVGIDRAFSWLGIDWVVDEELPGAGTSSSTCFLWHKAAVGCASDTGDLKMAAGYDDEQDRSWARTSIYMGGKLLQNSGVIKMLHNDASLLA